MSATPAATTRSTSAAACAAPGRRSSTSRCRSRSALVCALTAAALVLGAALSAIWIGLPLVLAAVAVCARLAELERRQANRLLNAHIPPLPAPAQHEGTMWRRALASLTDREGWRVLAFVAIKAPLSVAALAAGWCRSR